ncbi:MAG: diguanylate cyclase [Magnetococcales bacterium]|nr:diguanylate cyclase [Magnetococcales bacterium]
MDATPSTILVVDDQPGNIDLLADILIEEHEVLVATNGQNALETASARVPDMILLDVAMPGMDGFETCRQLKANAKTSDIPVVFVSSRDGWNDEKAGFDAGAIDYITRPFRPAIVQSRLRSHLASRKEMIELKHLACTDALTGLANRRRFDEAFRMEARRAARDADQLSLIMIDVDHFKRYNDHYGHFRGDECLKSVAEALRGTLRRPSDLLARFGGEEFAAILCHVDQAGTETMANEMCARVESRRLPHGASLNSDVVTVSIGYACLTVTRGSDPNDLLEEADRMLYKAKQAGRNRVRGIQLSGAEFVPLMSSLRRTKPAECAHGLG